MCLRSDLRPMTSTQSWLHDFRGQERPAEPGLLRPFVTGWLSATELNMNPSQRFYWFVFLWKTNWSSGTAASPLVFLFLSTFFSLGSCFLSFLLLLRFFLSYYIIAFCLVVSLIHHMKLEKHSQMFSFVFSFFLFLTRCKKMVSVTFSFSLFFTRKNTRWGGRRKTNMSCTFFVVK